MATLSVCPNETQPYSFLCDTIKIRFALLAFPNLRAPALLLIGVPQLHLLQLCRKATWTSGCPSFGAPSLRRRDAMRALVEQVFRQLVGSLSRVMEN